jgi:ribonucleoside-diphosphate reductase alpha chain
MALMTGAGIGVWYGDVRESGSVIERTGGVASGPVSKASQVNETGRHTIQGGNRRSAIWAGLPWWHKDVFEFVTAKDWSEQVKELKASDPDFPAKLDMTNISVTLDDRFFEAYENPRDPDHVRAHEVYEFALGHMLRHGEPGFTVDRGSKAGEVLRNACTEITSADDSDVCNLGSLVLPRFDSPREFGAAVRDMALFLTAGTLYSHVPYTSADLPAGGRGVDEVRDMNRRLGLGIIGLHEFLIDRGVRYGSDDAFEVLDPYMREYARALEYAHDWQDKLGLSHSKGATAIAPNGTIGIVAESTPSADPIFSTSEIRTVVNAHPSGNRHEQHVVVDPIAKRKVAQGIDPATIEDAYTLSYEPERRIAQVAYLQQHVDHAISGTINIPAPVTDPHAVHEFGQTLIKHLPNLRGITVYPDGARTGQPRQSVDLAWALERDGTMIETDDATCVTGVCGV